MDDYLKDPPFLEDFDDFSMPKIPDQMLTNGHGAESKVRQGKHQGRSSRQQGRSISTDGRGTIAKVYKNCSSGQNGQEKDTAAIVNGKILLVALIKQMCKLLDENGENQQKIFFSVCQPLVDMGIVPALVVSGEFESIRDKFSHALVQLFMKAKESSEFASTAASTVSPSSDAVSAASIQIGDLLSGSPTPPNQFRLSLSRRALELFQHGPGEDYFASRYNFDFVELNKLGKGGFGQVYKVYCKLDKCEYAVKKITFDIHEKTLCFKVLREVELLAKMNHVNVVRYYGAWLEFEDSAIRDRIRRQQQRQPHQHHLGQHPHHRHHRQPHHHHHRHSPLIIRELADDESYTNNRHVPPPVPQGVAGGGPGGAMIHPFRRNLSSPSISFVNNNNRTEWSDSNNLLVNHLPEGGNQAVSGAATASRSSTASSALAPSVSNAEISSLDSGGFWQRPSSALSQYPSFSSIHTGPAELLQVKNELVALNNQMGVGEQFRKVLPITRSLVLYVQMELCSLTLKDYIVTRNNSDGYSSQNQFWCVNREMNEKILKQLLKGVSYVHEQGLIHRDIKPGNIFLRLPNHDVLLGDFGLACISETAAPPSSGLSTPTVDPTTVSSSQSEEAGLGSSITRRKSSETQQHSSGVGTLTYSAPEQINSSEYDSKVDMFSIGMIAYELYCPFRTNAERLTKRIDLRRGLIDESIRIRYPLEAAMIGRLLSLKPDNRPSAQELLKESFLKSKDKKILMLERKVSEQEKMIDELRQKMTLLEQRFEKDVS